MCGLFGWDINHLSKKVNNVKGSNGRYSFFMEKFKTYI